MGGKEYTIDCSKKATLPDLSVTLGGKSFTLSPGDYVLSVSGQCLFAFMPIDVPRRGGRFGSWAMSSCASTIASLTMVTRKCAWLLSPRDRPKYWWFESLVASFVLLFVDEQPGLEPWGFWLLRVAFRVGSKQK